MTRIVTLAHVGRRHAGTAEVADGIDIVRAVNRGVVLCALLALAAAVLR